MPGPNRQPIYSPGEPDHLIHYNENVQLYLLVPLLLIIFSTIAINILSHYLSFRRKNQAKKYMNKERPSAACARTGINCSRWFPGFIMATFRKWGCKRSRIAEYFGLSALGEVIVIGVYWLANLILVVCGAAGSIDFMAHHAARLTYVNLPLVIGLASKNNTISWATGISYEALNVYHRAISRLVFFLSFIHVFGRVYINYPPINPQAYMAPGITSYYSGIYDPLTYAEEVRRSGGGYLIAGTIAFVSFSLMIVLASRSFRNAWYSFFIISHVFLFLLGTVALCIHRPTIAPWLYAGFLIYFIDRILRTGRIIWSHTISVVSPEEVPEKSIGLVEALSSDLIRVTVQTTLNWSPGQHVYLHCPVLSAGGHPFSVCSIDKPMLETSSKSPRISEAVLLIRVRAGLTRRLYDLTLGDIETNLSPCATLTDNDLATRHLPRYPSATVNPVWLEGAYGKEANLDYYQTLLLVAGGSGVSYTLPLMLDYVRRARAMKLGFSNDSLATERITFVWILKKESQIDWIRAILEEAISLAPPNFLRVLIYITDPKFNAPSPPSTPHKSNEKSQLQTLVKVSSNDTLVLPTPEPFIPENFLVLRSGRPNFPELLEEQINSTDYSDYFCCGTCGPSGMTSQLANAISDEIQPKKVLKGEKRRNIRFTVQEFGW